MIGALINKYSDASNRINPHSSLFENDYVIIIEYLYGLFHSPP
jgi:hypothetical protein